MKPKMAEEKKSSTKMITLVSKEGTRYVVNKKWACAQLKLVEELSKNSQTIVKLSIPNVCLKYIVAFVNEAKDQNFPPVKKPIPSYDMEKNMPKGDIRLKHMRLWMKHEIPKSKKDTISPMFTRMINVSYYLKCAPLINAGCAQIACNLKNNWENNHSYVVEDKEDMCKNLIPESKQKNYKLFLKKHVFQ